jgi:predicted Rossmann fold flavoprotein
MVISVIGGGAAGFFAAINCAEHHPEYDVYIFEKSNKILSKVRVSGGGRCNVTNGFFDISRLADYYPRGNKELQNAFSRFSKTETVNWFESRGVKLKTEADGRMFPVSDNSDSIIRCLTGEANKLDVNIRMNYAVTNIHRRDGGFELEFSNGEKIFSNKIIITSGGSPTQSSYDWICALGHSIIPPVPSLYTFNIPGSPLKGLEGISSQSAAVSFEGFKFKSSGPVLITHWGISGPAVLRLSAFAARWLNENNYTADCVLNWLPQYSEEEMRSELNNIKADFGKKKLFNSPFQELTTRLWQRMCYLSGVNENENWADANKAKINKLAQNISAMRLPVKGKTTFKEEFVTCGGINLKEVDTKTMESKIVKGIYFAGEILDVDGITGGFNFQAAWTTGYLAGINS